MIDPSNTRPLSMWAGIECTVNRVADRYYDQLVRTGHEERAEDIDHIAWLGVRTVRYPVIWERTVRDGSWSWTDARLGQLRSHGIAPIAGLVHHGSGPEHTHLLDPAFPEKLAVYAGAVARRYPWIDQFTPVNEPLTTARFSGLYGHWYPHGASDLTFARCLLTECKATVLAMRAIREVTPAAQLVITEDIGYTRSTPRLRYQADYENERRWVSLDLLCGRLDRWTPMARWFHDIGVTDRELDWFLDNPCPPDVIGCNYYVTSERYLDDQLGAWPAATHGGNSRHRYADVEAVRACGLAGVEHLIHEVHARYELPIAITEAHLGCTREQQMRWLVSIYDGATRARGAGVDVRAVTAWSMFGAVDWHCLVTRDEGRYEPGLFDVRGGTARPTALARLVRELAAGRRPTHPVIDGPGWWQRCRRAEEHAA